MMTTIVEKTIVVGVPVRTAYDQWTQFEDFPRFMEGVESVTQITDDQLEWVAEIGGVRRQWVAMILEQIPDQKVSWAAMEGATNAGTVTFAENGVGETRVTLSLEYEPEGFLETLGDKLGLVERQVQEDLDRFRDYIESQGQASGGWRGAIDKSAGLGDPMPEAATPADADFAGRPGLSPEGQTANGTVDGPAAGSDEGLAGQRFLGDDPQATQDDRPGLL